MNVYSSTIHSSLRWKQPRCLPMDELMNSMWPIHIVEYYSAIKRKKVLIHATTWMTLRTLCYMKEASDKRLHLYV